MLDDLPEGQQRLPLFYAVAVSYGLFGLEFSIITLGYVYLALNHQRRHTVTLVVIPC